MSAIKEVCSELLKVKSTASFEAVCSRIDAACKANKFGVLGSVDLQAKMAAKSVEFDRHCTVFEVCNPLKAKEVLSAFIDLASALPCRIAVYTEGEFTVLSTLKPTILLGAYKFSDDLSSSAIEVENTMETIMMMAAGSDAL